MFLVGKGTSLQGTLPLQWRNGNFSPSVWQSTLHAKASMSARLAEDNSPLPPCQQLHDGGRDDRHMRAISIRGETEKDEGRSVAISDTGGGMESIPTYSTAASTRVLDWERDYTRIIIQVREETLLPPEQYAVP